MSNSFQDSIISILGIHIKGVKEPILGYLALKVDQKRKIFSLLKIECGKNLISGKKKFYLRLGKRSL